MNHRLASACACVTIRALVQSSKIDGRAISETVPPLLKMGVRRTVRDAQPHPVAETQAIQSWHQPAAKLGVHKTRNGRPPASRTCRELSSKASSREVILPAYPRPVSDSLQLVSPTLEQCSVEVVFQRLDLRGEAQIAGSFLYIEVPCDSFECSYRRERR